MSEEIPPDLDVIWLAYIGELSESDIRKLVDEIEDEHIEEHPSLVGLPQRLGMSWREYDAFWLYKVDALTIARLRYEGWPSTCSICGNPISLDDQDCTIERTETGDVVLQHHGCWLATQEDVPSPEDMEEDPIEKYRSWSTGDLADRFETLVAEAQQALETALKRLGEAGHIFSMTAAADPDERRPSRARIYGARLVGICDDMDQDVGWAAREADEIRHS